MVACSTALRAHSLYLQCLLGILSTCVCACVCWCCVRVCVCQWGTQVNPTEEAGVNDQLLCPSVSTPAGIHLAVRHSVTPHRKRLMDSPSVLPSLLSLYVSLLRPPTSICWPSALSFHLPHPLVPRVHFDFATLTRSLHFATLLCVTTEREEVRGRSCAA